MSNRLLLLRRLSPPSRGRHHRSLMANRSALLFNLHHRELLVTGEEGSPIIVSSPPLAGLTGSNHPFSSSTSLPSAGVSRPRTGVVATAAAAVAGDTTSMTTTKTKAACSASRRRTLGHRARVGERAVELQDRIREEGHEEALPRREKKKAAKGKKKKKHKKYEGGHDDEYEDDSSPRRGAAAPPASRSERNLADEYDEFARGFDEEDETDDATEAEAQEGPTLPDVDRMRTRMMKVVSHLERSFRSIRGNEPTPEMFESISVVAYGTPNTPLTSVAQVVIASPTLARLTCYDPENATAVAEAVRDAGLNLNPRVDEGGEVIVPIPKVSAETRRALSRQIGKMAEASRVRVRGVRKKAHDACRRGRDGKLEGISKDDAFRVEKEVDAATDEVIRVLNDVVEKKQESLMAV